ncbi:MAG: ABC transporter permease subunit [Spirochaetales bacterium]|nr:ABC transporter permease subunit [Spirochaetales bacterium]
MNQQSYIHIFKREIRSFFFSPSAYIVMAIFLLITGWFFFSPFFLIARADMRSFFALLPIVFSFTIPAITMKQYAEEYKSGSFEILRTLPVSRVDILMGKFLAVMGIIGVMLLPTIIYLLSIAFLGDLDIGAVAGGYIGTLFLASAFTAVGLLCSAVSENQIVAFILGAAVCFFLVIIDRMLLFLPGYLVGLFQYLSASFHFHNFTKGILDTRDVFYFLTISGLSLYGIWMITRERV